jgi:hypothetical protein
MQTGFIELRVRSCNLVEWTVNASLYRHQHARSKPVAFHRVAPAIRSLCCILASLFQRDFAPGLTTEKNSCCSCNDCCGASYTSEGAHSSNGQHAQMNGYAGALCIVMTLVHEYPNTFCIGLEQPTKAAALIMQSNFFKGRGGARGSACSCQRQETEEEEEEEEEEGWQRHSQPVCCTGRRWGCSCGRLDTRHQSPTRLPLSQL